MGGGRLAKGGGRLPRSALRDEAARSRAPAPPRVGAAGSGRLQQRGRRGGHAREPPRAPPREAIPRPAVAFAVGPSPLLQGWREFRRSGAPVRFLCFENGAWADVDAEAAVPLRRAFLDGRVVAEAAYAGRAFLFDFLRMVRIDAATAEEVPMGWIDDRGACFFPVPETGRKRKRGQQESADASSSVEERSNDDTVESGSGRASKSPRGAWGKAARLEEMDKFYQVVKKLFLSGMAPRAGSGVAITAVHKVA